MQIGDNIVKFRKLKGLSQQEVADEIKEKRSTYAEWERGIEPKASALVKIAKVLGVSASQLLEGVDDKPAIAPQNGQQISSGFVPADQVIADLRRDKEWLQSILASSLSSIVEGQQQAGIQIKALSWFSALAAAGGDEKKAEESLLAISNRLAFYEEEEGEGDNSNIMGSKRTSGKRK